MSALLWLARKEKKSWRGGNYLIRRLILRNMIDVLHSHHLPAKKKAM